MMNKIKIVLLLGIISPAVICVAKNNTATIKDGEPIVIFEKATHSQSDKGNSISASIDGHSLTIYINENVGIAHIVVTNSNGVYIDRDNLFYTPDMATLLIEDEGFYRVTITLSNGEVYYGDFQVTE